MPSPRLLAIVTALLMIAGASPGLAAYTVEQLAEIERLILARDTAGLGRYLAANPGVTVGDDPLAKEFRQFLGCSRSGELNCFSATRLPKPSAGGSTAAAQPPAPAPVPAY